MTRQPLALRPALLRGAFGSEFALTQTALKAIPLALTGLAVAVCLRMRLWNIGAEGQFHAGAIGATWAALTFSTDSALVLLPLMVGAAMVAGAAWALIAAIPRALWGVNEIITTPFSTATRESAMKPTAAEIDNGIPGLP